LFQAGLLTALALSTIRPELPAFERVISIFVRR